MSHANGWQNILPQHEALSNAGHTCPKGMVIESNWQEVTEQPHSRNLESRQTIMFKYLNSRKSAALQAEFLVLTLLAIKLYRPLRSRTPRSAKVFMFFSLALLGSNIDPHLQPHYGQYAPYW